MYEFYITGENFEEDVERKLNETSYDVNEAINDAMYIYERFVHFFKQSFEIFYFVKTMLYFVKTKSNNPSSVSGFCFQRAVRVRSVWYVVSDICNK